MGHSPPLIIRWVDARSSWIDEIARTPGYEWFRVGPRRIETTLAPGVPCQIMAGGEGDRPVLYVAIGHNCTIHYWQWASVDQETKEPLPLEGALDEMWLITDLAIRRTRSEVVPELRGWEPLAV